MYQIDYSNIKRRIKFYMVFLLSGLFFLFCFLISIVVIPTIKTNNYKGQVEAFNIEIISETIRNDNGTKTVYTPLFSFKAKDNNMYTCKSKTPAKTIEAVGDNKTVYYDINNPEKCITEYDKKISFMEIYTLIIPILLIFAGVYFINKQFKKMNKIKQLAKTGKLVKGLKYRLVESTISINNRIAPCIQVEYEVIPGKIITLKSEPRLDFKLSDKDGLVDLLIDPVDETNYYIDFDIK